MSPDFPDFGLIAGINLRPNVTDTEVDRELLDIIDKDNQMLLKILGFEKDQREALSKKDKDLFGHRFASIGEVLKVGGIGAATIRNARDKIRLGRECYAEYRQAFIKFTTLARNIEKGDAEETVRKKAEDVFSEHRRLLIDSAFLPAMRSYFEHDPQALLSLAYIAWIEIRAGPEDVVKPLVDLLGDLAKIKRGTPLSYYRLAAIRYLDLLGVKKNALALINSIAYHPPENKEFYDAAFRTLVDLAIRGNLSEFYVAIKPEQNWKVAALAIKAVSEARPGTDDLNRFLITAKRHPNAEVQRTIVDVRVARQTDSTATAQATNESGAITAQPVAATTPGDMLDMPLAAIHDLHMPLVETEPVPSEKRVLLSANLFRPADGNSMDGSIEETQNRLALEAVLNKANILILEPDEMRRQIMRNNINRNNLTIVMTDTDYEAGKILNASEKTSWTKSGVLILQDRLIGANYLYLEGVVGLAKAMMRDDELAIKALYQILTGQVLSDEMAAIARKNPVVFAVKTMLKFKPIAPKDADELDRLRRRMEGYLRLA